MTEPDRITEIVKITDHVDGANALVARVLRNKPLFAALLASWTKQVQDIEDALWQLLVDTTLDTAEDDAQDQLGEILGEVREDLDTAAFRKVLKALAYANQSDGTPEDLIETTRRLLETSAVFSYTELGHAAVLIEPVDPLPAPAHSIRVLKRAKAAGIELQLITPPAGETTFFTFAPTIRPMTTDPLRGFGKLSDPLDGGPLVGVLA